MLVIAEYLVASVGVVFMVSLQCSPFSIGWSARGFPRFDAGRSPSSRSRRTSPRCGGVPFLIPVTPPVAAVLAGAVRC